MSHDEEPLPGGGMGGAVRVGSTVRRPAGPWSPTIQRLLAHLRAHGACGVPEPLGVDESGRDRVEYLPGVVPHDPLPGWVWAEDVLVAAARRLAGLHDASRGFDRSAAVWQLPPHHPAEVICHNDVAPYNMVFDRGRLVGLVDWDTAAPGPRVWDLAYLAYRLVPLTDPEHDGVPLDAAARVHRLRLLCDAYGHDVAPREVLEVSVVRLAELAGFTEARATDDERRGHVALYRRDAGWIAAHTDVLLGRGGAL